MGQRTWIPALAWGLFILVLTLLPAQAVPGGGLLGRYHIDKLAHAVLFGVFLVLLVRAFGHSDPAGRGNWRPLLLAALLAIGFGALTEVLQEITGGGRSGDIWDVVADATGVIIAAAWLLWGAAVLAYFRNRRERYF